MRHLYVMAILQKFGHHLKELRSSRKMTQEDLAEQSGLSAASISEMLSEVQEIFL